MCLLYLIEILHQTTTPSRVRPAPPGCILSKFYIKPQLCEFGTLHGRVVSYRNSTSNHNAVRYAVPVRAVVSYRNSTSNHNHQTDPEMGGNVVSYRNSTSNHNSVLHSFSSLSLYLIEILHQTTTLRKVEVCEILLYLIEILHQTTTLVNTSR